MKEREAGDGQAFSPLSLVQEHSLTSALKLELERMIFDRLHLKQTSFPTHQARLPAPATAGYIPYPVQSPTSYIPSAVPPNTQVSILILAGNSILSTDNTLNMTIAVK